MKWVFVAVATYNGIAFVVHDFETEAACKNAELLIVEQFHDNDQAGYNFKCIKDDIISPTEMPKTDPDAEVPPDADFSNVEAGVSNGI